MKNILVINIILFIIYGCAHIVAPLGGPKDETPPKLIKSKPPLYSRNYSKKEFELYFDEFIQLKELQKKLIVSPPTENKPEIINKGKSLAIEFTDDLKDNTTYTINFADAIADNNEGNPISQFEFVFSTGNQLDSLSISGSIFDAFTNAPAEGVLAMLYDNLEDSAPLKQVPYYVSKTDKQGNFKINNMKLDTFRLFVLKDLNMNYKYDMPDEIIGFADSLVFFNEVLVEKNDTISKDSIVTRTYKLFSASKDKIAMFKEENKLQYISKSDRSIRRKITLNFNRPLYDIVKIEPVFFIPAENWYLQEEYINKDTVEYWFTDTSIINLDTMSIAITYNVLDSVDNLKPITDTVFFRYRERTLPSKQKRKKDKEEEEEQEKIEILPLTISVKENSNLPFGLSLSIESAHPLDSIDKSKIHLYQIIDSNEVDVLSNLEKHPILLRKYLINFQRVEKAAYKILIEPYAFTDIYGLYNDTINLNFKTPAIESYGKLLLNMKGISSPVIVQLLTVKDEVIQQKAVNENNILEFEYIYPGTYKLKLIFDENGNKKWDTGNYLKRIQPERILNYPGELNIRANWDVEQEWDISSE